jgi:hypothetical protein
MVDGTSGGVGIVTTWVLGTLLGTNCGGTRMWDDGKMKTQADLGA